MLNIIMRGPTDRFFTIKLYLCILLTPLLHCKLLDMCFDHSLGYHSGFLVSFVFMIIAVGTSGIRRVGR